MPFRQFDEFPLGDRVLGIELAAGGGLTLTLTDRGAAGGPPVSDRLRLRAEDVPSVRSALDRALLALSAPARGPQPARACAPHGRPAEGLVRRFHQGETVARIAARYGRTPDAVRARLRELGHDPCRPEYCPASAGPTG